MIGILALTWGGVARAIVRAGGIAVVENAVGMVAEEIQERRKRKRAAQRKKAQK